MHVYMRVCGLGLHAEVDPDTGRLYVCMYVGEYVHVRAGGWGDVSGGQGTSPVITSYHPLRVMLTSHRNKTTALTHAKSAATLEDHRVQQVRDVLEHGGVARHRRIDRVVEEPDEGGHDDGRPQKVQRDHLGDGTL